MFKKAVTAAGLLALSLMTNAAHLVVQQSSITGADMAGMDVGVLFEDSSNEFGIWQVLTNTPLSTGDPIIDANGFSGGVVTNNFSLTQAGFSLGGFDDAGTPYGMWTLTNTSGQGISAFIVSGFLNSSFVAFDIDSDAVQTPGSEFGQAFVSDPQGVGIFSANYLDQVDPAYTDLYWTLLVGFDGLLLDGDSINFFADTDLMGNAVPVSTPATMGLLLGGLVLLSRRATRIAAK